MTSMLVEKQVFSQAYCLQEIPTVKAIVKNECQEGMPNSGFL